jgi:hypothetical protein
MRNILCEKHVFRHFWWPITGNLSDLGRQKSNILKERYWISGCANFQLDTHNAQIVISSAKPLFRFQIPSKNDYLLQKYVRQNVFRNVMFPNLSPTIAILSGQKSSRFWNVVLVAKVFLKQHLASHRGAR